MGIIKDSADSERLNAKIEKKLLKKVGPDEVNVEDMNKSLFSERHSSGRDYTTLKKIVSLVFILLAIVVVLWLIISLFTGKIPIYDMFKKVTGLNQ